MRQPHQLGKLFLGKLFVGLMAFLLAVFMTVEVAHTHPANLAGSDASTHCQLCSTAHIAVASQPAWLTGFVLRLIGKVTTARPSRGSRTVVRTAFIRPPPSANSSLV